MRYDLANQPAEAQAYSHVSAERRVYRNRRRAGVSPLLIAVVLLVTAAMCVALLMARARITALYDECSTLADTITELADEHARLTIEYESLYSLEEIEDYARNVLGMVPGTGG